MLYKKKILVVDGDSESELKLKPMLESHRYQSLFVNNAIDGLSIAADWQPHLILLELDLPHMSGLGFLREIKYNLKTKNIPVVILSDVADIEVIYEALELGAAGFVNKADGDSELLSLMKDCVVIKNSKSRLLDSIVR